MSWTTIKKNGNGSEVKFIKEGGLELSVPTPVCAGIRDITMTVACSPADCGSPDPPQFDEAIGKYRCGTDHICEWNDEGLMLREVMTMAEDAEMTVTLGQALAVSDLVKRLIQLDGSDG